jgi:hypothetical protein
MVQLEKDKKLKSTAFSWKYVLFSLMVGGTLLLCLEIFSRVVHYQRHGAYPLALQSNIVALKNFLSKARAEKTIEHTIKELKELGLEADDRQGFAPTEIKHQLLEALYSEKGTVLLDRFRYEYEEAFKTLVRETRKIESQLWVLYIPHEQPGLHNRVFFEHLAEKYSIRYIDCTEVFSQYPLDYTTLLPENGHLSRFGNKLVVTILSDHIDQYSDYRSSVTFRKLPEKFGDLKPDQNTIQSELSVIPYQLMTNSQGLRMEYDLTFPKEKQRILILGDSYTFGPHLPNRHGYPDLLDKKYPDKEIINAGKSGYTITDEVSLFMERAKYLEPDITILQVLENDISGFFYFWRNQNDRENRTFRPSPEEIDLIKSVAQ